MSLFSEKMKLVSYLVHTELSKIKKFGNGLPSEYGPTVKLATTLKVAIWAAKNVELHIREKNPKKTRTRDKRKSEGSSKSNKKSVFSKLSPNDKKYGGNNEVKWCDKFKKKHFRRCDEVVTCFKCGKMGHYANECTSNKKVCFEC